MIVEHAVLSTPLHSPVLWLIPFLPLFGAIINGATGRWLKNNKLVDLFALGSVFASFLLVLWTFVQLMGMAPENRSVTQTVWTWLNFGDAQVLGGKITARGGQIAARTYEIGGTVLSSLQAAAGSALRARRFSARAFRDFWRGRAEAR